MLDIYPSPMNINIPKKIPSNANINVNNFHRGIVEIVVKNMTYNVVYIFHMYIRNQNCWELTKVIT